MSSAPLRSEVMPSAPKRARAVTLQRLGMFYARTALGAAFLSAVASRLGLLGNENNFAAFTRYTAEVNSFMPAFTIPYLAWAATAAEFSLGVALLLGIWPRGVALGSALLLMLFGSAMAISFGIKSPLDYSVFSASAAALLLALRHSDKPEREDS
jgi:putative oxidoreductase